MPGRCVLGIPIAQTLKEIIICWSESKPNVVHCPVCRFLSSAAVKAKRLLHQGRFVIEFTNAFRNREDERRMRNFLKVRRWEAGMKQYELATRLHCSAPYLSIVENGRIDPPDAFKAMVAQIFNLKVEEIFPQVESVEGDL